jgi:transcriptional regulator with XRE-family HTH domain
MTTKSANIRTRDFKEVIMVPLEWVVMLAWNKESRREVADAVSQQGVECSQEYIRKLENGEAASVSTKILTTIAKTLDVELIEIMSDLRVEVTNILCT